MYITYAKRQKQTQSQVQQDWINNLFDGILDEMPEPVELSPIIRTVTKIIDTPNSTQVSNAKLMVTYQRLKALRDKHPNPEQEYNTFKIPKKKGGFRTINAPRPQLSKDLKSVANMFEEYLGIKMHDSAWAYIKGRDVVGAMKEHQANQSKWYLKIDLKKFFDNCTPEFIKSQLSNLYPFSIFVDEDGLDALTHIACLNGGLPQGTPLSPTLTNMIMVSIDYQINKGLNDLIKAGKIHRQRYIYTRYADDICISAKKRFDVAQVLKLLNAILKDTPLSINREKTRFGSSAGRNWNLGLMTNKDNNITVGYRRKQRMKVMLNRFVTDPSSFEVEDLRHALGELAWLAHVEPEYFKGLMEQQNSKYHTDILTGMKTRLKHLIQQL